MIATKILLPLVALVSAVVADKVSGKRRLHSQPRLTAHHLSLSRSQPTFSVSNLPDKWEKGQVGTNQCKKYGASSATSMCQ